ncbi:hypothetical protein E2C01_006223 [Portunus trituberculatus]|uniref:Uncharacterized protein n=1 Tax=Portunus trituberculatus TaxID=210409 RepID=A0A5B7CWJ1_PORTR|nr:hypothetical protein [Portunus trituberculatus]
MTPVASLPVPSPLPGIVGTFSSYFKGGGADPGLPPERPSPSRSVSPRRHYNPHASSTTLSPLYASSSSSSSTSPLSVGYGTPTPSLAYPHTALAGREAVYSRLAPSPVTPKSDANVSPVTSH